MTKKKQTRNMCVNVILKCVFVTIVCMESRKSTKMGNDASLLVMADFYSYMYELGLYVDV